MKLNRVKSCLMLLSVLNSCFLASGKAIKKRVPRALGDNNLFDNDDYKELAAFVQDRLPEQQEDYVQGEENDLADGLDDNKDFDYNFKETEAEEDGAATNNNNDDDDDDDAADDTKQQLRDLSDSEILNPGPELPSVENLAIDEIKPETLADVNEIPYQKTNDNEQIEQVVEEPQPHNNNDAVPDDLPIEDTVNYDETSYQQIDDIKQAPVEREEDEQPQQIEDYGKDVTLKDLYAYKEPETPAVDEIPEQQRNDDEQAELDVEEGEETPEQRDEYSDEKNEEEVQKISEDQEAARSGYKSEYPYEY